MITKLVKVEPFKPVQVIGTFVVSCSFLFIIESRIRVNAEVKTLSYPSSVVLFAKKLILVHGNLFTIR
eukprot:snap_masked-scaffold_37-processed-gene-0.13-mRNA-1 protein AED:1.00 eAED:1.00 QI:0/0/0/0/1/1/2/0/67